MHIDEVDSNTLPEILANRGIDARPLRKFTLAEIYDDIAQRRTIIDMEIAQAESDAMAQAEAEAGIEAERQCAEAEAMAEAEAQAAEADAQARAEASHEEHERR